MHYWKQEDWNLYRLVGETYNETFKTFDQLYLFCKQHGINARQA